jgi:effector-binding domain-containing protein
MSKKWIIVLCVFFTLILIGLAAVGPIMSNVEQPSYKVLSSTDKIQVREYAPTIVAEVKVQGDRKEAINQGFKILADYIFGNNTANDKIAMTAPVTQQEKLTIAMTAPVTQQATDNAWVVQFTMPAQYTMDTLPKPNNSEITIRSVPAKKYIVLRFSGRTNQSNISSHESKLMTYIADNDIKTLASPIYAFYNPPWTLPFMRRNEVMVEIVGNNK